MDRTHYSERDVCTKLITPAIQQAGWLQHQFREEVSLTDGRVMVRGKLATRIKNPDAKGGPKRADFVLYARPNLPIAVIEAKQAKFSVGHGMQQALAYAEMLDAPFAISSNGEGFLFHDRTGLTQPIERELSLTEFPSPDNLWPLYQQWKGLVKDSAVKLVEQPFYSDGSGKEPRYYQRVAINRSIEAIAKGQQRVLLVMATGTGKTYTAFQIIWRLWKAKAKKRILFLADRNILVDQTMQQDFAPFGEVMHKVTNREVKKNYEIYLALYQAVTGREEWKQIYRQFPADFFDLVVIDECHRGSAADDSAWRDVLDYFNSATHLGLTATPKETKEVSNITYFGDPVYTYSLKQGIEDGFLAPYKVIRIATDADAVGYTPEKGKVDKLGQMVELRQYNTKDFDRNLVLEKRTRLVASKVWEYLRATDPLAKTIVFCDDQDHAERMRQELVKLIPAAASNRRYVMRITGDDNEGKAQLSYFIDNDEPYPVIATTSKLLTTGVDAKTCKLIVLDQNINSMTEFKQIIGRGTRLREDYQKLYFTIMDFKGATRLFADPDFDGDPVVIYEPKPDESVVPPEVIEVSGIGEQEPPPYGLDATGSDENPPGSNTGGTGGEGRVKYVIDDVNVRVAVERSQYLDADGKLITEDYRVLLKDDIKKALQAEFGTLTDFLRRWNSAERKQAVLKELADHGVPLEILQQAVANGSELDVFDLVTHVAFDQKPLTRRERANNVKKRDVFAKYGEQARAVLEALLDKFADHGVQDIEDAKVLELPPFDQFGSKTQIRRGIFGSVEQFTQAVQELEQELYDQTEQRQA
ncbi:TPA: DEAD/DEAH box helicase family protein [Pseudomonas aeruginosa]|uniref:EcoAI/FtnUII family type I restriction enzme subunit R n=1 Tax=Pseudomonas aeruginosa TaxID=287 RepID=UPI00053D3374|nr:DEAD/DEAH box helicase family protein [Pseudomonas aeruginosa]AYK22933.1 DEAD/DEAH box helicase [Pseudomonas aeruginosa]EIU1435947.1 DEAD/DEAH box helicase family protein [Pseudomonas aeruginosa]EKU1304875.1 DEAD/DEAH box helicase family protein [Pseudomonas aeruginosa]EKU1943645.1 DEAD/DEAH box helicase family protein [Pseudomonas aeruginosa]EKU4050455.1 DEAD/DEAH box helicase family protein [Pseudomonas aeruginosa]